MGKRTLLLKFLLYHHGKGVAFFVIFFLENCLQYMLIILFPLSSVLLDPPLYPYTPNFMFVLYLKLTNKQHHHHEQEQNKHINKTTAKQAHKQKQRSVVWFVLASYSWWCGLLWSVVDKPKNNSVEENWFFPVLHIPILHGFSAREETLCRTGIMSGLSLHSSVCAVTVFVSLCVHLSVLLCICLFCCVWEMLCPWTQLMPLALIIFQFPLLLYLIFERRGVIYTSNLRLRTPKSLSLCTLSCCYLS